MHSLFGAFPCEWQNCVAAIGDAFFVRSSGCALFISPIVAKQKNHSSAKTGAHPNGAVILFAYKAEYILYGLLFAGIV